MFTRAMALRVPWAPVMPVDTGLGSANENAGRWQEPQLCVLSALSPFSQKSSRPSSTPSTVVGLSGGMSIGGKKGGMSISKAVAPGGALHSVGSSGRHPAIHTTASTSAP